MKFCMNCMAKYGDDYSICPICSFKEGTLPTDQRCMEPGQVLAERYIIGMPMAIDSWLIRYIGWDALTERKVVINEYFPTRYAAREVGNISLTVVKQKSFYKYMAVLLKKAQLLSETHIPDNISSVYECFEKNNTAYIITEYFEGTPLNSYIQDKKPMELKSIERLMLPVMKSMDKLHDNGFISGGFSPDNFIVTDDNVLILNNYIGNILYNITDSGSELKCTPADKYFPCERLIPSETVELSPENDVYSAAMIIYEMLGADLPDTNKRKELFEQKHKDLLKKPSAYGTKLEKYKENALINAAAVNIASRTANMETFIKEFTSGKDVTLLSHKQSKFPLWAKITIPAVGVLIIAAAVMIPLLLNQKTSSPATLAEGQTIVPSIVNYSLPEAAAELQKRNLLIEVEGKEINDDKDANTILSQGIDKGSIVSENTVVGVTVSAKSGEFTMPNFLGIEVRNCTQVLENIGLNYTIEKDYNPNISADCVVSQSISPYSKVTAGQRITLVVSLGPEPGSPPPTETTVEKLVDQPYEQIIEKSSPESAPVQVVERVYDNTKPEGTVLQQSPAPGEKTVSNEPVKIVVTVANEDVIIPDVTYLDKERIEKLLNYYGLKSEFDTEQSDTVAEGLAVSQTPAGGQQGKIGDTLKVILSKGKETVKVPDAVGKMRDESVKLMKTTGLAVTYSFESDNTKPRDEVLSQSIAGGTEVKKGTEIILTLNTSTEIIKIPDIMGMDVSEADKVVTKAGLNLIIYVDDEHPYSEGIVAAQGPKPGILAEKGSDMVVLLEPSASQDSNSPDQLTISADHVSVGVGEEFKIGIDISKIKKVSAVTYDIEDPDLVEMLGINKEPLEMTFCGTAPGTTEITINCGDLHQKCTVEVTGEKNAPSVPSQPEQSSEPEPSKQISINISPENVSIDVGMIFIMTIETSGIEDLTTVEYDISDESVVGVDHIDKETLSMSFKGIAPGNAEIVISCGDVRKTCTVEVT